MLGAGGPFGKNAYAFQGWPKGLPLPRRFTGTFISSLHSPPGLVPFGSSKVKVAKVNQQMQVTWQTQVGCDRLTVALIHLLRALVLPEHHRFSCQKGVDEERKAVEEEVPGD